SRASLACFRQLKANRGIGTASVKTLQPRNPFVDLSLISIRSFMFETSARVAALPIRVKSDFDGRLVRSRGLPEITTDLLFAFYGLGEFLKGLQQPIGIACFQCGVAQLSPVLARSF